MFYCYGGLQLILHFNMLLFLQVQRGYIVCLFFFFFKFFNNWTVRALHSPDHTPVHRLLHLTHTHTPLEVKEPVDVGSPLSSTPCYSPPSCSAIGPDSLSHFSLLLRGNQATPKFNCHVQVSILKKTFHAQSDTRPFVFS